MKTCIEIAIIKLTSSYVPKKEKFILCYLWLANAKMEKLLITMRQFLEL